MRWLVTRRRQTVLFTPHRHSACCGLDRNLLVSVMECLMYGRDRSAYLCVEFRRKFDTTGGALTFIEIGSLHRERGEYYGHPAAGAGQSSSAAGCPARISAPVSIKCSVMKYNGMTAQKHRWRGFLASVCIKGRNKSLHLFFCTKVRGGQAIEVLV